MKTARAVLIPVLVLALSGCVSHKTEKSGRSNRLPDAETYTIEVLLEASPAAVDANAKQTEQVRSYMERDLVNILTKRGGFKAQAIASRDKFVAGPKHNLVAVKILKYSAGSKAARMLVGYGAGAASLDIQYDIVGQAAEPLLTKLDGVGTSRDWYNCVRKLNENILAELNKTLGAKPAP